ncbi:MAG: quinone-dependent dihydroorotate dehydrogenase [Pseudomonadota bacterium]
MFDWYKLAAPALRALDPETAHRVSIHALKRGLVPRSPVADDPILRQPVWGREFPNPVGLAPGFDKNAEVFAAMLARGFGFVEVGTVTPRPQAGNPRPRVFRLAEDEAVINRLGMNGDGLEAVRGRLARRPRAGLIGINFGINEDSADAIADYVAGAVGLAPWADYLVCNVSSPNTPGLRDLQGRERLTRLLERVQAALSAAMPQGAPPLLVKIAPDLAPEERRDIAEVALASGVAGLVVSNTTLARPAGLKSRHRGEAGGLSGRPLFGPSTELLADLYRLTHGKLPLVGCGGISGGADAYLKIRAGASLVQLYTALIYRGPQLVGAILRELALCLRADGFASVGAAIGADHRLRAAALNAR